MSNLPERRHERHRSRAVHVLFWLRSFAAQVNFGFGKSAYFSEKSANCFFGSSRDTHFLCQGDGGFAELAVAIFVFFQRVIEEKYNHLPC